MTGTLANGSSLSLKAPVGGGVKFSAVTKLMGLGSVSVTSCAERIFDCMNETSFESDYLL